MSDQTHACEYEPDPRTRQFYLHALSLMDQSGVRYVVGGGYAMACYTGIIRHTKDLDVFVKRQDRDRVLEVFAGAGYETELHWPHFLAKAINQDAFVDILYGSANGLCTVDDAMLAHPVREDVLGRSAPLCPVEEMIWSKAFVQSRDRFDGADIMHLIRARAESLDWKRLRNRFRNGQERVLLTHLLMFGYVYPSERQRVPFDVIEELFAAVKEERPEERKVCRGTFLSNDQYLFDVAKWGYADARLKPHGPLTFEEIASISPTDVAKD
jgi:hypothetical protein